MGVTVQVRNLDASVQERLNKAAAQEGLSLSAFLRRELTGSRTTSRCGNAQVMGKPSTRSSAARFPGLSTSALWS